LLGKKSFNQLCRRWTKQNWLLLLLLFIYRGPLNKRKRKLK
jgi:hypothetical protein